MKNILKVSGLICVFLFCAGCFGNKQWATGYRGSFRESIPIVEQENKELKEGDKTSLRMFVAITNVSDSVLCDVEAKIGGTIDSGPYCYGGVTNKKKSVKLRCKKSKPFFPGQVWYIEFSEKFSSIPKAEKNNVNGEISPGKFDQEDQNCRIPLSIDLAFKHLKLKGENHHQCSTKIGYKRWKGGADKIILPNKPSAISRSFLKVCTGTKLQESQFVSSRKPAA